MNLKMLALSAQGDAGTSKMLARISGAFSGFADETEFAVYDSLKTLLPPFAEALKTSRGIVLAIQKSKYNSVRAKLCAALALETAEDKRLYDLISEKSDELNTMFLQPLSRMTSQSAKVPPMLLS